MKVITKSHSLFVLLYHGSTVFGSNFHRKSEMADCMMKVVSPTVEVDNELDFFTFTLDNI